MFLFRAPVLKEEINELEDRDILTTLKEVLRKSIEPYKEPIFDNYPSQIKEEILNKLVIVRYWKKKSGENEGPLSISSTGHISLQTRQHYASCYPDISAVNKKTIYNGVESHLVEIQTDYFDTVHGEGRPPEEIFLLFDLDVNKINSTYEKYKQDIDGKKLRWAAYGSSAISKSKTTNCVKLTAMLLAAGGVKIDALGLVNCLIDKGSQGKKLGEYFGSGFYNTLLSTCKMSYSYNQVYIIVDLLVNVTKLIKADSEGNSVYYVLASKSLHYIPGAKIIKEAKEKFSNSFENIVINTFSKSGESIDTAVYMAKNLPVTPEKFAENLSFFTANKKYEPLNSFNKANQIINNMKFNPN